MVHRSMTQKLTCFLASIGPSQTPITILSIASSAAACHVCQVNQYFFICMREHGNERELFLFLWLVNYKRREKETNLSSYIEARSTTTKNKKKQQDRRETDKACHRDQFLAVRTDETMNWGLRDAGKDTRHHVYDYRSLEFISKKKRRTNAASSHGACTFQFDCRKNWMMTVTREAGRAWAEAEEDKDGRRAHTFKKRWWPWCSRSKVPPITTAA